ncbi:MULTISPECIES: hypothetical protein [Streptomyces]|uniref:hypothetical protein n=1 Tax=Streptomyces scabiei TaxID=1930 RepID=UPI001B327D2E|nr:MULTISPECIES: hypothetical protein [Streptomyces]MBP5888655.1 hypothetical protein [Streptomyces sp. LBUM 1487]MDW8478488.1 hypothetical protein [Streptomyces scabiei]
MKTLVYSRQETEQRTGNMQRTITGAVVLIATMTMLTGCGSDSGDTDKDADGTKAAASKSASPTAEAGEATHEVTLQVDGTGSTQIMYKAESSGFEQQKLPWTLTEKVNLTQAHQQVGYLVSIVPGSVKDANGMLQPAPCVIKVDGKQVADNDQGKDPKGCSYKIK